MILIFFYPLIFFWSLFNNKLKESRKGQGRAKEIRNLLDSNSENNRPVIWLHAASAGEFEQISPLIDLLYLADTYRLILSVSSSTIMNKIENDPRLISIFYNPWDLPFRTMNYVNQIQPDYYINTRHDIWFNLLCAFKNKNIPTILINANLYKSSKRLKFPWLGINKAMFAAYSSVFTATEYNKKLLKLLYNKEITVSGDTRFDRVYKRMQANKGNLLPDVVKSRCNIICYGSVVTSDMTIIQKAILDHNAELKINNLKHLIVPHEVDEQHLCEWESLFKNSSSQCIRKSKFSHYNNEDIIIWDTVGELADLYGECQLAYVGAGFSTGVHNVIEPAIYGIPVAYGPYFEILSEAIELKEKDISKVIYTSEDLNSFLKLLDQPEKYKNLSEGSENYVMDGVGASKRIIESLKL